MSHLHVENVNMDTTIVKNNCDYLEVIAVGDYVIIVTGQILNIYELLSVHNSVSL